MIESKEIGRNWQILAETQVKAIFENPFKIMLKSVKIHKNEAWKFVSKIDAKMIENTKK